MVKLPASGGGGDSWQIIDSDEDSSARVESSEGANNNEFELYLAGDRKILVTSTDGFVNGSTPMTFNGGAGSATLETQWLIRKDDSDLSVGIGTIVHTDTAGRGGVIFGGRTRGTEGSETATQDGDALFDFAAVGYDGTDFAISGRISFYQNGAGATASVPGGITFNLTKAGDSNVTEFMDLNTSGLIINDNSEDFDVSMHGDTEDYVFHMDGASNACAMLTNKMTFTTQGGGTALPTFVMNRLDSGNSINQWINASTDTASRGAFIIFARSRGTIDSPAAVTNGDRGGIFRFDFYDGAEYVTGGSISMSVTGAVSSGIVPTGINFQNRDTTGTLVTNMWIGEDGDIGMGTSAPFAKLDVRGGFLANFGQDDVDIQWYGQNGRAYFFDGGNDRHRFGALSTGDLLEMWTTKNEWNRLNADINMNYRTVNNNNTLFIDAGDDTITVGSSTSHALLGVDGQSDEVQLLVQANSTQTSDILVVESSAGADYLSVDGNGYTIFHSRYQGAQGSDIASATNITLGAGNYFDITGTTNITSILNTGWQAGATVRLQFDGVLTLNHAGSTPSSSYSALYLGGATNITVAAGDVITLTYDGTYWRHNNL